MAVLSKIPGINALRIGATCCTVALVPVVGHAASITFDFSASGPPSAGLDLFGAVSSGGSATGFGDITGSLVFDDTTPNTSGTPSSSGFYSGALSSLSFIDSVGNAASASTGDIDVGTTPTSRYVFQTSSPISSSGYGVSLTGIALLLADGGGTAVTSSALPSAPPALSNFGITSLTLTFLGSDGFSEVNAIYDLDTLSLGETTEPGDGGDPGVIPLPAGLPLLLAGLGGLGLVARRKRKTA